MSVLGAEGLVDLRVQALGDEPRALDEAGVELAGRALELGLDELGVRAGLLAVEHARADLERVVHEAGRVLAGVLARPGQAHDGLVGDDETVDVQAAVARVHVGQGQRCGSFHVPPMLRAAPDGPPAAPESSATVRPRRMRRETFG